MGINRLFSRLRRQPAGFNLTGFLTGGFGLGEAARQTLRRMIQQQIPVTARDVDTLDHRLGQVQEFTALMEKRPRYWPGKINLFHINPSEFENLLVHQWPEIPLTRRLNVMVPFWELPMIPPDWIPCLKAMDAVLAPTQYVRDVIRRALPDIPVLHFPQNIPVCTPAEPNRARFGLPDDVFAFLCAFDIMSDVERKNPLGAVAAFRKAFPDKPSVRLVLKVSNTHDPDALLPLRQTVQDDPRIMIIAETLPAETLRQLYASCDALVSLHRAEGLGLIIMEMMMQAKPVIVTAWSGNMDFTTEKNACLVKFSMIPVRASHPAYKFTGETLNLCWAEADTDSAARWMQKLAGDPEFCEQLGQAARNSMLERAGLDSRTVFNRLLNLHARNFRQRRESRCYFKRLMEPIKHRQKRLRMRRIEKAVKNLFR